MQKEAKGKLKFFKNHDNFLDHILCNPILKLLFYYLESIYEFVDHK